MHGIVRPSRQVGRFPHFAGFHIDDARHADANALQVRAVLVLVPQVLDCGTHFTDHEIRAQRDLGAQGYFFEQLTLLIDRCNAKVGAAEIDAD